MIASLPVKCPIKLKIDNYFATNIQIVFFVIKKTLKKPINLNYSCL